MIPGLGPILAAGPVVAWIVGALEGAVVVGGLSALGAGLYRFRRKSSCWTDSAFHFTFGHKGSSVAGPGRTGQ
jgi:hypothetical protein